MKYRILIPVLLVFIMAMGVGIFFLTEQHTQTALILTDQSEYAFYAEVFNATQKKYKVAVVYTENPAQDLTSEMLSVQPDIIVGPWLKSEKTRVYFRPLDYFFNEMQLNPSVFYKPLLDAGRIKDTYYLFPVSFNLPAIIFDVENQHLISDDFMLSLDEIRDIAAQYNVKNKAGIFVAMGFSPHWDAEFLYIISRLKNASFRESSNLFEWDDVGLQAGVEYVRRWTVDINTSFNAENDFQFKYLYSPTDKWVVSSRALFAYMRSDELLLLSADKLQDVEFRWVHENNEVPIDDGVINMGIYKKSRNTDAAEAFMLWFISEEGQRAILEHSKKTGMLTKCFGISGGFSAVKKITETVFPLYYSALIGHLPQEEALQVPYILPYHWDELKDKIVLPYLQDATAVTSDDAITLLGSRIISWQKQN